MKYLFVLIACLFLADVADARCHRGRRGGRGVFVQRTVVRTRTFGACSSCTPSAPVTPAKK